MKFFELIEQDLESLKKICLLGTSMSADDESYANAIIHYLEENQLALQAVSVDNCDLQKLVELRSSILDKSLSLVKLNNYSVKSFNVKYQGELCFLLGLAYTKIEKFSLSKDMYQKAYQKLTVAGSSKKALKSLLNKTVAESRLNNHKNLITDYELLIKLSKEIKDKVVEGVCLLNLSREYQMIGALELAAKYATESIDALSCDSGVDHYYHALIQRCHLYIEQGLYKLAVLDYQKAKAGSIKSAQEALKVIEVLLGDTDKSVKLGHLEPTWRARLKDFKEGIADNKNITPAEAALVQSLANGEKSKEALIEEIYGTKIDWFAAESRFKMLLSRFRKKKPGLITYQNKKYKIIDSSFLSSKLLSEA